MGGMYVVPTVRVAGDRTDLISLNDQLLLQAPDSLYRLPSGALTRIANRN